MVGNLTRRSARTPAVPIDHIGRAGRGRSLRRLPKGPRRRAGGLPSSLSTARENWIWQWTPPAERLEAGGGRARAVLAEQVAEEPLGDLTADVEQAPAPSGVERLELANNLANNEEMSELARRNSSSEAIQTGRWMARRTEPFAVFLFGIPEYAPC